MTAAAASDTGAPRFPSAVDQALLARYYGELRGIARQAIRGGEQITFQPTDLVHAAALRLMEADGVRVQDEAHLLALAARTIRLTFIDEVRRRKRQKRDAAAGTPLDEADMAVEPDLLRFDGLLDELVAIEPEGARVVELHFYAGMTMKEIAGELATPERTVRRRWATARAWLLKELLAA